MKHPALPIPDEHWRSRWLRLETASELHRVARIEWEDGEMIYGQGTTVCGAVGHLSMPGIFSRMGAPRCRACCEVLNLPPGDGTPYNNDMEEPS